MGLFESIAKFLSSFSYKCEGNTTKELVQERVVESYEHPFMIPVKRKVWDFYGYPGEVKISKKWERNNMILVKNLPGKFNNGKGRIYCHKYAAPAIREALRRCEIYGVLDYIVQMGCFNYRRMRNNPAAPLSYHAGGFAIDINNDDNKLKHYPIEGPKPHSDLWWDIWPKGVPELLVKAFKEAGFSWGGDWKRTPDPMHFELIRR